MVKTKRKSSKIFSRTDYMKKIENFIGKDFR